MAARIPSPVHSYDSTVTINLWLIDPRAETVIDPVVPSVIGRLPENSTMPVEILY